MNPLLYSIDFGYIVAFESEVLYVITFLVFFLARLIKISECKVSLFIIAIPLESNPSKILALTYTIFKISLKVDI